MQTKENPNLIRIVEIYSSRKVYEAHIASAHFHNYKTGTPHMIKDLKLVDMNMLVPITLKEIFRRVNSIENEHHNK